LQDHSVRRLPQRIQLACRLPVRPRPFCLLSRTSTHWPETRDSAAAGDDDAAVSDCAGFLIDFLLKIAQLINRALFSVSKCIDQRGVGAVSAGIRLASAVVNRERSQ